MENDGAYFDQFERTFNTQVPQVPQVSEPPFSSFLFMPNEPEEQEQEQEEVTVPEPTVFREPPSEDRFQGVVDFLKDTNAHRDKTDDTESRQAKYMTRLISYLLNGKALVNKLFGELDPQKLQDDEIKKILGTIQNANEIIDQDETSKYQLSMTNTVINSFVGLISQQFPDLKELCDDVKTVLKHRYEHSNQKDYQIPQLNFLAHFGKLDNDDKIVTPVTSISRTHDFMSGLIIPISLLFADQIGKEFVKGTKKIGDHVHEAFIEPPLKRARVQ